jgi:uncharacterized protein (DUF2147 family)
VAVALVLASPRELRAEPVSPVGKWKTIDDKTKQPKSIVQVWEQGGRVYGKIVKLLRPDADPNARCDKCTGDKKDQPIVGLVIIEGMKADGDEWSGGRILDPENGKSYKCILKVEGSKLKVRGYIGVSALGRTQYWLKE